MHPFEALLSERKPLLTKVQERALKYIYRKL